jgi:hypothetical protein
LHAPHGLLTPVNASGHRRSRVASLLHRFKRRGALFMHQRDVLPAEGVPAKSLKVKLETFSRRPDDISQNIPTIERLAVLGFTAADLL